MHRFYTDDFPRPNIAALAPLVDQAAAAGDAEAAAILIEAGRQLALYASAVRDKLFAPTEPVPIVQVGGVFLSSRVREGFAEVLGADATLHIMTPRFDPALGALLRAYDLTGARVSLQV
jgi:N-acetylglucosamine kinase-like BadF-type ATPase